MTLAADDHVVEGQSKVSDISSRHTMGDSFHKARAEIRSTEDSNYKSACRWRFGAYKTWNLRDETILLQSVIYSLFWKDLFNGKEKWYFERRVSEPVLARFTEWSFQRTSKVGLTYV
jgi:hypothetical protein